MLLLGVEKDGRVSGLVREGLEERVMTVCREKIRPAIIPFFEIVPNVDRDSSIAIIRVTRGYGVHALWHDNANQYLIRAERQPISGATLADLDLKRLRNYFSNVRQQDVPMDEDAETWRSLLVNMEIMVEESVSVGGMLLFGLMPSRFLPHVGIDAVAHAGSGQDYNALVRTKLRGPMTPILDQSGSILENGLVEQALSFVKRNGYNAGIR